MTTFEKKTHQISHGVGVRWGPPILFGVECLYLCYIGSPAKIHKPRASFESKSFVTQEPKQNINNNKNQKLPNKRPPKLVLLVYKLCSDQFIKTILMMKHVIY